MASCRTKLSLCNFLRSNWPSQHYVLKQDLVNMCQSALVIRPLKTVPDIIMCRQGTARHVTRTKSWPKNQSQLQTRQRGVSYSRLRITFRCRWSLGWGRTTFCLHVNRYIFYAQNEGPIRGNICGSSCSSCHILHIWDYWTDVDKFVTKYLHNIWQRRFTCTQSNTKKWREGNIKTGVKCDANACACSTYGPVANRSFIES